MDAADLLTGDRLLNDDGSWAEVVSSEVLAEPLRAYNLTVEGWHTYFVAANVDAAPVWVHNTCDWTIGPVVAISKRKFNHIFTNHGQDATNFILHRAAGSGKPMGQFLDDQAAARFIIANLDKLHNGAKKLPIPDGFPARIVYPDGTFGPARSITLVPSRHGVTTAYPNWELPD
ncbi:MAG TPA: hypothetical protein ENK34_07185 [Rhodobacteraceae bacterium]|nr:hypothetical protein [Paracoccaceae bacterium]